MIELRWTKTATPFSRYRCPTCSHWHLIEEPSDVPVVIDTDRKCDVCLSTEGKKKTIYANSRSAAAAAQDFTHAKGVLARAYPCPFGVGWHITSKQVPADDRYLHQVDRRRRLALRAAVVSPQPSSRAPQARHANHPVSPRTTTTPPQQSLRFVGIADSLDENSESEDVLLAIVRRLQTLLQQEKDIGLLEWVHIDDLSVIVNLREMFCVRRSSYERCGDHFRLDVTDGQTVVPYTKVAWR